MRQVEMTLRPGSEGWWLDCDLPLEPTYYCSGGNAERVAGEIAIRISDTGRDVRLVIFDRNLGIVATRRYFGA
ncbi:MAG: hypothetical protein GC203_13300 [Phenylobacterium sp.]|uniref:hypothetical protein n=1 Tax=Phenylobacterium sp. TaxID=1871053 RepID=UPI0025E0D89C|nr:hypothetical protein [Phenylobacterium sp.]MBI1198831.1 hypothetical protein [Phenylobacterium sp.]